MAKIILFLCLFIWFSACNASNPQEVISSVSPLVTESVLPVMPGQVSNIADNQWRLTEVNYQGEQRNLDNIEPILITFHPDRTPTLMSVKACASYSLIFDRDNSNPDDGYRLLPGEVIGDPCVDFGNELESFVLQALQATKRYELSNNVLRLFDDEAEISFVLDNEAEWSPTWPYSSKMPASNDTIAESQWRLTEVNYKGEQGNFDSIDPVLVRFPSTQLSLLTTCAVRSFDFEPNTDNGYHLTLAEGTATDCVNSEAEQDMFVIQALLATTAYKLSDNTLLLFDDEAEITFVRDNDTERSAANWPSSPVQPQQVSKIAENQWRLTEMSYQDEQRNFDSLEPVLVRFHPSQMSIRTCNRLSLIFDMDRSNLDDGYLLVPTEGTTTSCGMFGNKLQDLILQALQVTKRYELSNNTLLLFGDEVEVTFVLDNEVERLTSDWP